jgi:hypothetical protein
VSSEFERQLREGRETLPDPDAASTERARERALAAVRRPGRGRTRTVAALAALVVAALLGVGFAGASFLREPFVATHPGASRLVDRTFICASQALGGLPEIEMRAHAGIREGRSKWRQLPFAVAYTGRSGYTTGAFGHLYYSFAWITAGVPSGATTVETEWFRKTKPPGTLAVNGIACKQTTSRVPLSAAGLTGGAASPFGDEFDCRIPSRILIRIRAVLSSRASLRSRRPFLTTSVPVQEARLVVRTEVGKSLVYAEAFDTGKLRLFTATSCTRE